uniref:RanBD1 domain-containing protein n=2 Tax=Ditylum brightwellii TaxID=49249 RepID=A0A6S8ZTG3_9STRA|mmetsp:Transcript_14626/g.21365  ORF Transcript_14626/g.21365 Transcript_14626/m.21365 type:complete len:209 (+) Transcript_14626:102-728(+)
MSTEEEKPTEGVAAAAATSEEDKVKEEESTATFKPVVELEEVEVKSGEEDEEVVFSMRAKLFLFGETLLDKGTGNKSWRERGIGEARILRHREHQRLRFLMRQEKTMKVIANHAVDPRIKLEPNAGSDRSWVWSAFDFSDGELEETVFALRFADSEIANDFKTKFLECQKEMEAILAGEDKPGEDGGAGADEAAEALSGLKTKDDEEK